jgi:outer membrane protein assembly factor BamB
MNYMLLIIIFLLVSCQDTNKFQNKIPILWKLNSEGSRFYEIANNLLITNNQYTNEKISSIAVVDLTNKSMYWEGQKLPDYSYSGIGRIFHTAYPYVYFQTRNEGFRIYDLQKKKLVKIVHEAPYIGSSYWISGDDKYLVLPSGQDIFTYDITQKETPKFLWRKTFFNSVLHLHISENTLLVTLNVKSKENLLKLDIDNGQVLWAKKIVHPEGEQIHPATPEMVIKKDNMVYFSMNLQLGVRALNFDTGEEIWRSEPVPNALCSLGDQGSLGSQIIVAEDNIILISGLSRCVFAFQRNTGKIAWVLNSKVDPTNNYSFCGRAVYKNGIVYASNGVLWAVENSSGKVLGLNPEPQALTQCTALMEWENLILAWGRQLVAYKAIR